MGVIVYGTEIRFSGGLLFQTCCWSAAATHSVECCIKYWGMIKKKNPDTPNRKLPKCVYPPEREHRKGIWTLEVAMKNHKGRKAKGWAFNSVSSHIHLAKLQHKMLTVSLESSVPTNRKTKTLLIQQFFLPIEFRKCNQWMSWMVCSSRPPTGARDASCVYDLVQCGPSRNDVPYSGYYDSKKHTFCYVQRWASWHLQSKVTLSSGKMISD